MTIIFFQNCVSPHQMPYIKELRSFDAVCRVVLVVPRVDYSERAELGWNGGKMLDCDSVEFLLMPDDATVCDLFSQKKDRTVAVFNGIRADADVFRWFKLSLSFDVERAMFQEPPFSFDKPLWMHRIRFALQDWKYVKHFKYMLAIGPDAVGYFSFWGKWKIVPFLYCTEINESCFTERRDGILSICYVGSLCRRKNVALLLEAVKSVMTSLKVRLTIIGDGEEKAILERYVHDNGLTDIVEFCGVLPNDGIPHEISKHDVLVLPSLHDGWGAVVNEALSVGTYAIVSNKCGARTLLADERLGLVFKSGDKNSLADAISKSSKLLMAENNNGRLFRRGWSEKNISGKAVAARLVKALME